MKTIQKYEFYENSVQAPDADIEFIEETFYKFYKKKPLLLREDFCGSAALCREWVTSHPLRKAMGLDLDPEPLAYARSQIVQLTKDKQQRLHIYKKNVLSPPQVKHDVVCAFNYSFYTLKSRKLLKDYFSAVRGSLHKKGLFFLDAFGGTQIEEPHVEKRRYKGFNYYFECTKFNPINHECHYAIHYEPKGKRKQKNVFSYDWRLWSLPEIQEVLLEAGFSKAIVYWEGENRKGEGNGVFKPATEEENCLCWLAYVVGVP